ncbi:DMT family transporter [Roseovarius sp. SCSIO 43702]|uniref:DMT family transporter n=1 Tax=Roseovarius sp. SCSIO 43702 TaxID=2823043 RepID=UPI001C738DF9|nr:DMT family transporter [Roseovarius sp. SCSIO 43702]QYX56689.1 DMT family transporter [Roseovarius sp. SCSIO 43702]
MFRPSSPLAPVFLTALAAMAWGVWWIPVRYLTGVGMSGAQAGMLLNLGASLAAVLCLVALRQSPVIGPRALLGGALVGVALSTYSVAFAHADVVRVILLFYLAPAWSKMIEWGFMGARWRWASTLTVAASLAGAVLILGGRISTEELAVGDVLAVGSGVAWAVGATLIFTGRKSTALTLTTVTMISATAVAALLGLVLGEAIVPRGPVSALTVGAVLGAVFALPCIFATLWSAQRLAPALLTFLFTLEICAGVISGAILLDEPFGLVQVAGTCLIVGAALSEVAFALRERRRAARRAV